jgi:lysophospholipase L1-like esterase
MRVRPLIINLILLACSMTFVLGGLEFGLRLTGIDKGKPVPAPLYEKSPQPDISYQLKPSINEKAFRSMIVTNSLGFRSPELDPQKQTIAVLGDSIAFGYGVENDEMISTGIQKVLPTWNILNTGVSGYNLRQERATFEHRIAPLNPKALVLIFHWNDLRDTIPAVLADDGNIVPAGSNTNVFRCNPITTGILGWIPGKCWLDTHSALYRVMKKAASARTERANLKQQEQEFRESPFDDVTTVQQLQDYGRELDQLVAVLPPNFPRLFVIWPEKQLHFDVRPQLARIAEERGFRVLDLYDIFGNTPKTLSWDTVHPDAETAQTAGVIVGEALKHFNLLP